MTPVVVVVAMAAGFIGGLGAWVLVTRRSDERRRRLAERDDAVRSALFRALDDPGQPILDELGPSDAKLLEAKARALLPALRGSDRETLARLLDGRGATTAARRQCHSRRAKVRAEACQLLGDVGSSFTLLDLVPLLDDPRPAVQQAAARGLGRLGQPAGVAALLQSVDGSQPIPVDVAADAIQQIHDWPVSQVHPSLVDRSASIRALAAEVAGRCQAIDTVPVLIDLLENDLDPEVRVRAARALGRIGSPRALYSLIDCVSSGPGALRTEAVAALGRMGASAAVPTLRITLLTPSPQLVQSAAAALSAIEPNGVDLLLEIADDAHHPAATAARRALAARDARSAAAARR